MKRGCPNGEYDPSNPLHRPRICMQEVSKERVHAVNLDGRKLALQKMNAK